MNLSSRRIPAGIDLDTLRSFNPDILLDDLSMMPEVLPSVDIETLAGFNPDCVGNCGCESCGNPLEGLKRPRRVESLPLDVYSPTVFSTVKRPPELAGTTLTLPNEADDIFNCQPVVVRTLETTTTCSKMVNGRIEQGYQTCSLITLQPTEPGMGWDSVNNVPTFACVPAGPTYESAGCGPCMTEGVLA